MSQSVTNPSVPCRAGSPSFETQKSDAAQRGERTQPKSKAPTDCVEVPPRAAPTGPDFTLLSKAAELSATVKQELGLCVTSGLKRAACVGGITMTLGGLILGFSGAPVGGLGVLAITAGCFTACVLVGAALYSVQRRRNVDRVKRYAGDLMQVRNDLRQRTDAASREALPQVERALALIKGGWRFAILEVLRGTILEPAVALVETLRNRWHRTA